VQEAIDYTKAVISDLLMNRLDISMLVISKSISKKMDDYKNKQTHTELAAKMMKRDPSTAPHLGDRVPYVMIKSEKGAKAYEKSEDPIYVLENNIPIDTKYYLEHQLAKPLCRVFAPILKEPEKELLSGDHTRNIFVPTPTVGGIMKFAKKRESCLGCRNALQEGEITLCGNCKTKESKIYQNILVERNHYETIYSRVWTQCQRCQQSLHQDILCSNRDCPVFYMRKKVQKDLKESQEKLDKFEKLPDW
jgi:DNA polymerase delta subunit 1